jgi:hypothetical protein
MLFACVKRPPVHVWLILGACAVIPLYFVFATGLVWEDFLITYRFSENLAHGRGLVYTPGEHVHGFTSPLNVLLPALFAWLCGAADYSLPLWLFRFVSLAGLMVALVSALSVLQREHARVRVAAFVCCLFPLLAVLEIKTTAFAMNGQEAGLVLAFLGPAFAVVCLGWTEHASLGGVLWAGLMYSRPDACVYIALLGITAFCFETTSRKQLAFALLRSGAICALLYLPWFVFTWTYYGSPIPHTIVAKRGIDSYSADTVVYGLLAPLQAGIKKAPEVLCWALAPIYDWVDGRLNGFGRLGTWPRWTHDCELALELVAVLYWLVPTRDRLGRMASLFSFLIFAYLVVANLAAQHAPWYFPPLAFMSLFTIVAVIAAQTRRITSQPAALVFAGLALAGVGCLIGFLFFKSLRPLQFKQDVVEWNHRRLIGLWLKDHVGQGESVYLEPLGYIGYFSGCKMLDWPGLVSAEVVAARRQLRVPTGYAWKEVAERLRPTWIVARPGEALLIKRSEFLSKNYELMKVFDVRDKIQTNVVGEIGLAFGDSAFGVYHLKGGREADPHVPSSPSGE